MIAWQTSVSIARAEMVQVTQEETKTNSALERRQNTSVYVAIVSNSVQIIMCLNLGPKQYTYDKKAR